MIKRVNYWTRRFLLFTLIPVIAGMMSFSFPARAADDMAGFFSAEYLMQLCASDKKGQELVKRGHASCQSYISGVIDYHKLMKSLGTAPSIDFCVPNTEPMRKLQNIVFVYLADNTQHSDFLAAPAVTLALYEHYPCPEKKKPLSRRKR